MTDRADQTVWRVTAADCDALAGRELTDEELDRITSAICFSTAMEAVEAAVEQVVPLEEDGPPRASSWEVGERA